MICCDPEHVFKSNCHLEAELTCCTESMNQGKHMFLLLNDVNSMGSVVKVMLGATSGSTLHFLPFLSISPFKRKDAVIRG